jgi:hypothetical protein
MKRYAVLALALGLVVGATLRWATSPINPTLSPDAPDQWQ